MSEHPPGRVLFFSAPLLGHVLPMIPLAHALRDAGLHVIVATAGDAVAAETDGIASVDVAPDLRFGSFATRTMLRHPLRARSEIAGHDDGRVAGTLFGAVNAAMAQGLGDLAERWRPDVIVYESLAVAGAATAAARGLPSVLLENSLADGPRMVDLCVRSPAMRSVLKRQRIAGPAEPDLTLSISPPSLGGAVRGTPLRPVAYSGTTAGPRDLTTQSQRPRMLVSRSTVKGPGGGDPMPAVVEAAPELDAEIVLVRPAPRVAGSDLPPNVRCVDWVPLASAIPASAAVVHHGGAGTTLGALAAGVPQIAVPGAGDRRFNAQLVERRGAGLALSVGQISASALRRMLTDWALIGAANEVRDEIAAMPGPVAAAAQVAELVPREGAGDHG